MLTPAAMTGQSESHLVSYENVLLHPAALKDYLRMQEAAAQQGVVMTIASAFRSFDRQLQIWNRKFNGELPLYNDHGEALVAAELSVGEKIDAILTWSALPGGSRHHWGTDMDLYDPRPFDSAHNDEPPAKLQLIASEYVEGGPCYDLAVWLQRHAHEYGFFFPYARYQGGVAAEPWHLSHRETAEAIRGALTQDILEEAIRAADLQGKQCVLARLEEIKVRYIDNICTDNGWSNLWCG